MFCNSEFRNDSSPCYGVSTTSGISLAIKNGQKVFYLTQENKDQLQYIQMSGEEMANDINSAINAGGYAMLPERAVDGAGRSAVYVYHVVNPATGFSSWKISGGLNGGILTFLEFALGVLMLIGSIVAATSALFASPFILLIGAITLIGSGIIGFINSLESCGSASSIQFWLGAAIYGGSNALGGFIGKLVKYLTPGFLIGNLFGQLSSSAIGGINSACRLVR